MNRILSLLLVLFIIGCQGKGCNEDPFTKVYKPVGKGVDMDAVLAKRGGRLLPNSCSVVPLADIAEALELKPNQIEVSDSSPRDANPTHSSCFFKWDDFELSNAGILFQALRNPVGDEFPNYVEVFINSKKTTGEQGIDEKPMIFKTMEGLGDDGAYSTEAGKYFWRLGDQVVFSIAFNTTHTPEQQYRIARNLGALLTQNYVDGK
jgi:hypothetical protein